MALFRTQPQSEVIPHTASEVVELLEEFALSLAIESCEQRSAGKAKISTQIDRIISQCDHAIWMINFEVQKEN